MAALIAEAVDAGLPLLVPAGVLAPVRRGSARQARPARLLSLPAVEETALGGSAARLIGLLCRRAGTAGVSGASAVQCFCEHGAVIVTSDPDDLRRLDPAARLVVVWRVSLSPLDRPWQWTFDGVPVQVFPPTRLYDLVAPHSDRRTGASGRSDGHGGVRGRDGARADAGLLEG